MSKQDRPLCRHCCRAVANRPRGLCWGCYYKPGVRQLYPSTSKYAPNRAKGEPAEETMEEVEALIVERLPTMPGKPQYPRPPRAEPVKVYHSGQRGRLVYRKRIKGG